MWYDRKPGHQGYATSDAYDSPLLLGVHEFNFSNFENPPCGLQGKLMKLKFTTCPPENFTCNDGQCIDMEKRCDQTLNCKDESDEDGCQMLFMKDNYNKKIPPSKFDEPIVVDVSLAVKKILKLAEVDHTFSMKFRLILEWYDHRLVYYGLKKQRSSNIVQEEILSKMWIPYILFENSENNDLTVTKSYSDVFITREGNCTRVSDDFIEEKNIFSGHDNKITFQEIYSKAFDCEYQLQLYPFDTQVPFIKTNLS